MKRTVPAAQALAAAFVALAVGVALGAGSGAAIPQEFCLGLAVAGLSLIMWLQLGGPTLPADAVPLSAALGGDPKADFMLVFKSVTDELIASLDPFKLPPQTAAYMRRLMDYNVPKGKLTRGLTVINALRSIKGTATLGAIDYRRAAALGWCVEWLQAFFLVADDIMDASETRRGQPCWYKLPDVKLNAVNDGILLEAQIYQILKKYFEHEPVYVPLLELFHEVTLQTALGQFLDLTTADPDKVDFSRFSMAVYTDIIVYKTAFYSFYLPVALGMRIAGVTDETLYAQAREICIQIGTLFQVQDDFLDCYGDPKVIGKIGTDIRENKCSWLINRALGKCTPEQRKELEANYAKPSDKCEKRVKDIYEQLGIKQDFHAFEEATHNEIVARIASIKGMPSEIFSQLLKTIYHRQK